MKADKLKIILENHLKWLNNDPDGKQANLQAANLQDADLRAADLRWANLQEANLRWADLREADLQDANLRAANLRWADLRWANLREADLQDANLRAANLRWADLREADLREADLREANLLYFTYNRDTAYFTFDGKIRIGCEYKPTEDWLKDYKEIGKKNNYTELEIMAYGNFIELCAKLQKEKGWLAAFIPNWNMEYFGGWMTHERRIAMEEFKKARDEHLQKAWDEQEPFGYDHPDTLLFIKKQTDWAYEYLANETEHNQMKLVGTITQKDEQLKLAVEALNNIILWGEMKDGLFEDPKGCAFQAVHALEQINQLESGGSDD
jgi:hypothetical protein